MAGRDEVRNVSTPDDLARNNIRISAPTERSRYNDGPKRGYLMCTSFCEECGVGVCDEAAHDRFHKRIESLEADSHVE